MEVQPDDTTRYKSNANYTQKFNIFLIRIQLEPLKIRYRTCLIYE